VKRPNTIDVTNEREALKRHNQRVSLSAQKRVTLKAFSSNLRTESFSA